MNKLVFLIGSAVYGLIVSCLTWGVFYVMTPWLMSMGWAGVVLYWLFSTTMMMGLVGILSGLALIPLSYLVDAYEPSRYLPILMLILFGCSSIAMPWKLDMDYSAVKIVMALSISLTAGLVYFMSVHTIIGMRHTGNYKHTF